MVTPLTENASIDSHAVFQIVEQLPLGKKPIKVKYNVSGAILKSEDRS